MLVALIVVVDDPAAAEGISRAPITSETDSLKVSRDRRIVQVGTRPGRCQSGHQLRFFLWSLDLTNIRHVGEGGNSMGADLGFRDNKGQDVREPIVGMREEAAKEWALSSFFRD